ncbi:MAG: hypothetical protein L3K26_13830, partial [Candidatus Hydrogenedentes bacterium]|nr:hypothetical protein [Candidatus Hydrogenedentota bacterium]
MNPLSIRVVLFVLLALGSLSAGIATASPADAVPGASGLSGTLSQYYGYLLTADKRAELDHVNRRLRETEHGMKHGETEAARAEALRVHGEKAAELLRLLDGIPSLMDVALPGAQPKTGPVELPGDSGAVLFRVNPGAGNPQCMVSELDFADGLNVAQAPGIDPARATYVLLSLKNVPSRTVSIRVG